MGTYKTYKAVIKEYGNNHLLTPTYMGTDVTKSFLINFFGLREADVEWYRLYDVTDGKEELL